jgi:hypothetical protein
MTHFFSMVRMAGNSIGGGFFWKGIALGVSWAGGFDKLSVPETAVPCEKGTASVMETPDW